MARDNHESTFFWIAYSDLMTSLFMSFMLIFIVAKFGADSAQEKAAQLVKENASLKHEVSEIQDARVSLSKDLSIITNNMTTQYRSECDQTNFYASELSIVATSTTKKDIWFEYDSDAILPTGERCLSAFAQQWLSSLYHHQSKFHRIKQIVIEGHASPEGNDFHNLKLSQNRAYNASVYILTMHQPTYQIETWNRDILPWTTHLLTATGRGRNAPLNNFGKPAKTLAEVSNERSRRLEFRVILDESISLKTVAN